MSSNSNFKKNDFHSSIKLINNNSLSSTKLYSSLKSYKEKTIEELFIFDCELNNTHSLQKRNFGEKLFTFRESYLTIHLNEEKNYKSIYYYCLSIIIWFLIWVIIEEYKTSGYLFDIKFLQNQFNRPEIVIYFLIIIYSYSLLIVFLIILIHSFYIKYKFLPYKAIALIYVSYIIGMYYGIIKYFLKFEVYRISGIIVGIELVRSSFKSHAYFRDKIMYGFYDLHEEYINFNYDNSDKKKNNYTPNKEKKYPIKITNLFTGIESLSVEMRKFLYFFFCPTFIYRDIYPRLPYIRWNNVIIQLFNFIICIFSIYIFFRYSCEPYFSSYNISNYLSIYQFIYDSLTFAFPGMMFMITGFFLILHTWQNLFSELLTFGDRLFYEDWWNCTNFEEYYRKWNLVVHEWLYYYVYNDSIRLSKGRISKTISKFLVFIISNILHEVIIYLFMGSFFPILGIFFGGPGILFTYIKFKNSKANILFWVKLFIGIGLILTLFLREIQAIFLFEEKGIVVESHIPKSVLIYYDEYMRILKD